MDLCENESQGGQLTRGEIQLLEPFIAAMRAALGEMVGAELEIRTMVRKTMLNALGDIAAVVRVQSPNEGSLVFGFPQTTAAAFAMRILTGVTIELNEELIRDCVGEIANVVTGQVKALLAETPYQVSFSLPPVVADAKQCGPLSPDLDCLVVAFVCDQGEFAMQLFLCTLAGTTAEVSGER